MPEDILVVEYEPRYTDRVRQALAGQRLAIRFARDGEEALNAIESRPPRLIVLSSVIPKIGTGELIRVLRGRSDYKDIPILITVSGYNGKNPKGDAVRLGATDILPKPYSEADFLAKVRELIGPSDAAAESSGGDSSGIYTGPAPTVQLTSKEIFGELLEDEPRTSNPTKKPPRRQTSGDIDQMLSDTLSGVLPKKREADAKSGEKPGGAAATEAKAKSGRDIEKMLEESLPGLDRNRLRNSSVVEKAKTPLPSAPPSPPAHGTTDGFAALQLPDEKVPASSPLIPLIEPAPVADDESDADGERFGPYVLLEKIATGGMAEVWKARRRGVEGFQKIVAIKKILPHLSDNEEFIEMFIDEAKLAAQLNHNNIIHIYDLGKIASSYYIAMELIDGHDLKTILKSAEERQQPMGVETALFIASKVASALDYAHRKRDFDEKEMGLVHRDVSPQNVLISYEGDIKLCDFGIAKAASKASHTHAGALKGKLQYMSPEQAWGKRIDRRSDIFALATVLYEMLAGRKLFVGDNEISILEQVREPQVSPPSQLNDEVSPEVDRIVLKALTRDAEARYQSAAELSRDLDAVIYSLRPTPTSADLAIYMHRLYSEPAPSILPAGDGSGFGDSGRQVQPVQVTQPVASTPDVIVAPIPVQAAPPAFEQFESKPLPVATLSAVGSAEATEEKKGLPLIPIAAAALLLLGIGGYIFMNRGAQPAQLAPAPSPVVSPVTVPPLATVPADTSSPELAPAPVVTPITSAPPVVVNEQARIDDEVRRRLESERTRIQAERTEQQAASDRRAAEQARSAASDTASPAQVAQQPPPPVQTAPDPPPQPAVAQQVAPPAAVAQQARVNVGDLVEPGTDGLVAPKLIKLNKPPYPPIAKMQRIEGIVVLSALISETGRVLDVKILRGVPALNNAASDAVRSSPFAPATKDGVRVRSRTTLTVPFKL
ncbi:MAG TPA: TonB family protein [Thermoanaerobaculia bacterium]|nr:TonB family protein [Thermoanaerobaculia bacterium]